MKSFSPFRFYLAAPIYLLQWFIGVWLSEVELTLGYWSRPKRGWFSDRLFDVSQFISKVRCMWINRAIDWVTGEDGWLCDCYDFEAQFEQRSGYQRLFRWVKLLTPRGWRKQIR
jgi:hypothetical protein